MEPDRNHINRILERLEVLRAGVRELDRLHASVRAEIIRCEYHGFDEEGGGPTPPSSRSLELRDPS